MKKYIKPVIFVLFLLFIFIVFYYKYRHKEKYTTFSIGPVITSQMSSSYNNISSSNVTTQMILSTVDPSLNATYKSLYSSYLDKFKTIPSYPSYSTMASYNITSGVYVCPSTASIPSLSNGMIVCSATDSSPFNCIPGSSFTYSACNGGMITATRTGDIAPLNGGIVCPPTTSTVSCYPSVMGSWFQMDFGSGKIMTQYGIVTDNPPYAPVSWTMTGSTDGNTWYQVDVRSGKSWTAWSPQYFSPSSVYAGNSYRYYRLIIQESAGSWVMTPSIFFASDKNGPIGWVGKGTVTTSSDLSDGHTPNWTMNDPTNSNGWTNYFMTNNYQNLKYVGSVSTSVVNSSGTVPFNCIPGTTITYSACNGGVTTATRLGDFPASNGGTACPPVTYTISCIQSNVTGSWFQMDFGSGKTMSKYGIVTDNPPYAPVSWTMAGSTDGNIWYQIDLQTGKSWSAWSPQYFAPSGTYKGNSYRYYRLIIQESAGSWVMTPSIFFASDKNGPIGWVGKGTATTSSDLSDGHTPNWTMNDPTNSNGWTNYFMTNNYQNLKYVGSVSTVVIK